MPILDLNIADKRFYLRLWHPKKRAQEIIDFVWQNHHEPSVISLTLTDDTHIQKLNRTYRKKNKPTNVLSFESPDKPIANAPWMAGDIVMSYDTLVKEKNAQHLSFRAHFTHLLIHGTLHLLGYDHQTEKQAQKMESLETKLMQQLGFADPYKDLK